MPYRSLGSLFELFQSGCNSDSYTLPNKFPVLLLWSLVCRLFALCGSFLGCLFRIVFVARIIHPAEKTRLKLTQIIGHLSVIFKG
jgi:hypothetical protein